MIGKTLAHYEITGLLGKGGMGEVYRARDTKLERDVALKVLPAAMAADPARLERFERAFVRQKELWRLEKEMAKRQQ